MRTTVRRFLSHFEVVTSNRTNRFFAFGVCWSTDCCFGYQIDFQLAVWSVSWLQKPWVHDTDEGKVTWCSGVH